MANSTRPAPSRPVLSAGNSTPSIAIADIDTRDVVYSCLLENLTLSDAHREALLARGMTAETIERNNYRTRPFDRMEAIAERLAERFGRDAVASVPGFYAAPGGGLQICEASGLLIPARDESGRIWGIHIRPDDGKLKYFWLSSANNGGIGLKTRPHTPFGTMKALDKIGSPRTVRITEGILKSDAAFRLDGCPTIGIPGVDLQSGIVDCLRVLGVTRVRLAFDADWRTNHGVAKALMKLAETLDAEGFAIDLLDWSIDDGKGIDDCLNVDGEIKIIEGSAAMLEIRRHARKLTKSESARRSATNPPKTAKPDSPAKVEPTANGTPERVGNRRQLPKIILCSKQNFSVAASEKAISADPNVFTFANRLVRVLGWQGEPNRWQPDRPVGSPVISTIESATLCMLMQANADYKRIAINKAGDEVEIGAVPPLNVVAGLLKQGEWSAIRPISGVIEAPTLRPDGSILDRPGWDSATGLLYVPSIAFPAIPDRPTQEDARLAADRLFGLVEDFPFASDVDRAAWLLALITTVCRSMNDDIIPAFIVSASLRSTGKSTLVDLIAAIATGRPMPKRKYTDDDAEMNKVFTTVGIEGDRCLCFDNVPSGSSVAGTTINLAVTTRIFQGRILGLSKSIAFNWNAVLFFTGNNIRMGGDALTRAVPVVLEGDDATPEKRTDFTLKSDCPCRCAGSILDHAIKNRAGFVVDALTILRAFHIAGRPAGSLPASRFRRFAATFQAAVQFATGINACESRGDEEDEDADSASVLTAGLPTLFRLASGAEALSSRSIVEQLCLVTDDSRPELIALKELVSAWGRDGELPSANAFGRKAREFIKRPTPHGKLYHQCTNGKRLWSVVVAKK